MAEIATRTGWAAPGALGFVFPTPRVYNSTSTGTRPCGGSSVSEDRTFIPLSGGASMWLIVQASVENISFNYANSSDPLTQEGFDKWNALNGLTAGGLCMPTPNFGMSYAMSARRSPLRAKLRAGQAYRPADMGFSLGDDITLQLAYAEEDDSSHKLYQCADITLISEHSFTAPEYTCTNTSTLWTDSISSSASASTVTVTTSASKLSPIAAGWIGAAVTMVVFPAVVAAVYMFRGRRSVSNRKPTKLIPKQYDDDPIRMSPRADRSIDELSLARRTTVDPKGVA